jgi:hypothetical protein
MEIVKKAISEARPHLSKQSISTYTSILKNLYEKVFGNLDVDLKKFDDHKKILEYLKDLEPNKRKTILSALVVLTDNKEYREQMRDDITEYNKDQYKQEMNEKQSESWVDGEEIKELIAVYDKNANAIYRKKVKTMVDLQTIQNYIILCLLGGVYLPPRRSKDYVDFKIRNINKDTDNFIHKNSFVFNSYKTAKTYGRQIVEVPVILMRKIKKWIKLNPTDYLLFDNNTNPLTNVKLNQRLNKLFGNKKVSVNQLRHTYLSDKYQDSIKIKEEMSKDLDTMGSSMIQEKVYIKRKKPVNNEV